ncbi:cell division protein ZapB [Mycobacterium sp. NPDC050441]|uniref:cell division protein ZapB n=1 Tax=Mycobacterium sp. NPDC050441 TaxID=3155403 RepID=UPI0033F7A6FC
MKLKNRLLAIMLTAVFGAGCSPNTPTLPSDTSPAAVAALLAGTGGTEFLDRITSYDWPDEGRKPSELFDWISSAAKSPDQTTSGQAGVAAHALAGFLADQSGKLRVAAAENPELLTAYAEALVPYQGAMVGDPRGTSRFEPLDKLDSILQRTASVFAVMQNAPAQEKFVSEAKARAEIYQTQFAEFAAANPTLPDDHPEWNYAQWSARLLGLLARSEPIATPSDRTSIPGAATSELRFAIVSRMIHGHDPRISAEYFDKDGGLISPTSLKGGPLSLYNAQLINYLSAYRELASAVTKYEATLRAIAGA